MTAKKLIKLYVPGYTPLIYFHELFLEATNG